LSSSAGRGAARASDTGGLASVGASRLLRAGLLERVSVLVAGADPASEPLSFGAAAGAACAELGARVLCCPLLAHETAQSRAHGAHAHLEATLERALADGATLQLLAIDGASLFARVARAAGEREHGQEHEHGRDALRACMEIAWEVTRAVAERAFLASGHGGRVVYLTPPPDAGEHARAAAAGLENLARTLSIEWARHGVTTVAVLPAASATAAPGGGWEPRAARAGAGDGDEAGAAARAAVASVIAYVASPAGAYFSGCVLDLRGPAGG